MWEKNHMSCRKNSEKYWISNIKKNLVLKYSIIIYLMLLDITCTVLYVGPWRHWLHVYSMIQSQAINPTQNNKCTNPLIFMM
jgi:hypothetical protein